MSTAKSSESCFGTLEPKNTKYVFSRVLAFVLEELSRQRGKVRFIQVGANDGRRADPIHPFIMTGRWQGTLIEPLPDAFKRLQETYSGIQGLEFLCLAIAPTDGHASFHAVDGEGDVLSSFRLDAILKHAPSRPWLASAIREIQVETRRLDSLLAERGHPPLDLLMVDAEGYDDTVLSTFDFARQKPAVIVFEHVLLTARGSQEIADRLHECAYTIISDRHDALAIHEETFPPHLTQFLREVVESAKRT